MVSEETNIPKLTALSIPIPNPGQLLKILPTQNAYTWIQHEQGLIAWGKAFSYEKKHNNQILNTENIWQKICAKATIKDNIKTAGSGLIGFTTFPFNPNSHTPANFTIPNIIIGKKDGKNWLTTIHNENQTPNTITNILNTIHTNQNTPQTHPPQTYTQKPQETFPQWDKKINTILQKIAQNELQKVVLARKITIESKNKLNIKQTLKNLAKTYPNCWTYSANNTIGATPEMLISVRKNTFQTKVLAGTISKQTVTTKLATTNQKTLNEHAKNLLLNSKKERQEHQYALDSLLQKLQPLCQNINFPKTPTLLTLNNVWHLQSNINGTYKKNYSIFSLLEQIHPTAAVCGTPRTTAFETINNLENFDRGNYAGPVGWVDYCGNGDFGIALRGGQIISENVINIFAGCGIVAGSSSTAEYQETEAKFLPILQALGICKT